MNDCLFCKIVRGELPSHKVYEDEHTFAFLDIRPLSPGHTLVIPKKHVRWVWDIPTPDEPSPNYADHAKIVQKIARSLQGTFGTQIVQSKIIGEEVPHAHTWLFPDPHEAQGNKEDFKGNAEKIREQL